MIKSIGLSGACLSVSACTWSLQRGVLCIYLSLCVCTNWQNNLIKCRTMRYNTICVDIKQPQIERSQIGNDHCYDTIIYIFLKLHCRIVPTVPISNQKEIPNFLNEIHFRIMRVGAADCCRSGWTDNKFLPWIEFNISFLQVQVLHHYTIKRWYVLIIKRFAYSMHVPREWYYMK